MTFGPDALHLGLESAVETVVIDFFVFYESILGYEFAETGGIDEIVFHSIPFLSSRRARCCADGKLELRVDGEQVIHHCAFAGTGRRGENYYFTVHEVGYFLQN